MANDETESGTNSPLATAVFDDTEETEDQQRRQQKNRFSFYDAKAVGNIAVGSSGSSLSPLTNENTNPKRFNFYDPAIITAASENYPSEKRNVQNQSEENDHEDNGKIPTNATNSDLAPTNTQNYDSIQITTGRSPKEDDRNKDADEILRSLQETEDQRMQILQPARATVSETAQSATARRTSRDTEGVVHGNGQSFNVAASTAGNAIVIDANMNANEHVDNSPNNSNNPYEDSIKAALTLLRKHRSSPKHSTPVNNANDNGEMVGTYSSNDITDIRTGVRYHDPNPNECSDASGNEDDMNANEKAVDDAVQEAKMKSKQRQERMAKYASRLQELKSSLPPEQQLTPQFSSSYTENYHHGQDNINDKDSLNQNKAANLELTQQEGLDDPQSIYEDSEQQLPNHIHRHIKQSLTEDSTGMVSELSQYSNNNYQQRPQNSNYQHQQQVIIEEQVQKGVEKVLVAILEASKNKTFVGGGGDSSCGDSSIANTHGLIENKSTNSRENTNDALLQVLHQILPTSRSIDAGSINSRDAAVGATATVSSRYSASVVSHESSVNNRSRKSSVVDELLAEIDDEELAPNSKEMSVNERIHPVSCNTNVNAARHWAEADEKKMTEEFGYAENRRSSETDTTSLILAAINHSKREQSVSTKADDVPDKKNFDSSSDNSLFESDASGKGESVSRSSYNGEEDDDLDTTFEDDEGSVEEDDNERGHHVGVLGPLSKEAGGTTGVVLDVESDSSPYSTEGKGKDQKGYFSSVVNYVASALSPEEEQQRILDDKRKSEFLASYNVVGTTTNVQDEEATELMRTLCAHLLPFGVDQKISREESTPVWDEENPNEPGYRIIRLCKSQLRRVERAFDAMITRIKLNSQSSLNGVEGQFDENFMRELEEAERLLDDEEERNIREKTSGNISVDVTREHLPSTPEEQKGECEADSGHPEFPGVKGAGKGEMGDLEYFQLPIIFKSHVTGFEPTKDMTLEPGNIIAGQYLVESELGSAAFSTAYRCVDLSSEDNDGHEEVCLKVIKNTKDFFDQSLDEIKILELLRQTGKCDENYILRVKTFFYYREHLIIVTELLRQNLFEFGKFIVDNDEEPYFTLPRLAYITRQCLIALSFVHSLGLVHSDVKPENILLGSYSRAQIKLIDFGSSCYLTDRQSSYIQSRSYRAPEVVLGLPYDGKIDVWSLGCVVAEMYTGDVTFQNDSIVSMLSRIEAFRGSFPRHMIAQGRQCGRFFTKSGLLYEVVGQSDEEEVHSITPPAPDDEESDSDTESEQVEFDIFQPKKTQLSSRLGFDADLMSDYGGNNVPMERQIEQMFTDFVATLLTIDPDGRSTAEEALKHPYMLYASSLTDEQIKYPSS
mmetsp:Transcript_11121/g.26723  ORF Transcript_11121/g.26723 Transcript_11121/m.26723 type:complete len:1355 (+) Transcript_11121:391-4455(+)|eukprot:CAMPEP_0197187600 /NCGR_PEP_ID=MMETSP1423-20130617/16166_1 /TAXON_ID=476441 /ORGANISM="Pseudo-nitzschia heimii, Strain UNC1101" /LENGTH=1354 /DNA_ID=CAMNT_0042639227 /DNA_START=298 /DNA_END=4362 /DNA_ORIENTATION=+